MPTWTEAQQAAIDARGANLLVSAAAGSGNTAVLAARIVALIKEGMRADRLLVVTFTKAAAAEMRARVLELLYAEANEAAKKGAGDARLSEQALLVERADICTLHSFCTRICREHFHAADVDPTFRVADPPEMKILEAQAMQAALTACYESPTEAFAHAAQCLEAEGLADVTAQLHQFLMARPDPWQWLEWAVKSQKDAAAETLETSAWTQAYLQRVARLARAAADDYARALRLAQQMGLYQAFAESELEEAFAFARAAEIGLSACLAALPAGKKPAKPRKPKDADEAAEEAYKSARDAAGKALKKAHEAVLFLSDLPRRAEEIRLTGLLLEGVAEAAYAYHEQLSALKQEENLLAFDDLEHAALRALSDPDVCEAVRAKYGAVFVDEYQDSSQIQEAIVKRAARTDNLFLVGDVKQSIYRFRLAEPGLFLQKLSTYSRDEAASHRAIPLNANFRSLSSVLDAVNGVFRRVFTAGEMELAYPEWDWLLPGKDWDDAPGAPVELHLVEGETPPEDGETAEETETSADSPLADSPQPDEEAEMTPAARHQIAVEADIIADRIAALREEGYGPRDIAILMRSVRGRATPLIAALRARGVAAWSDLAEDTLERPEVRQALALLSVIETFRQDIPLIAALQGPALGLSDEQLALIRIHHPRDSFADAVMAYALNKNDDLAQAVSTFIEKVARWRLLSRTVPLSSFIRMLYDETGFMTAVGAQPNGAARQANLRRLSEHAGQYQAQRADGLPGFLQYVKRIQQRGEGLAPAELGEMEEMVTIQSIHKSKGLQYPVVFVAGLGTRFRAGDGRRPLLCHAGLGLGMPYINPRMRTKWLTLPREAIQEKTRQEEIAEEARLLYVAMTRAEKRLILVGTPRTGDRERWQQGITPENAARAGSMLNWVAPCALSDPGWTLQTHTPKVFQEEEAQGVPLASSIEALRTAAASPPAADSLIVQRLSWEAPPPGKPLKQSVSALVKAQTKPGEEPAAPLLLSSVARRPAFLEEKGLTATERGDAVHAFLQAVPLPETDARNALDRMLTRGILTPDQAAVLPLPLLSRWLQSPLFARMRQAEVLRREWAFNLRIEEEGERTLLQGVIDCCFLENGQWVLVDYKTDRAHDPAALAARYAPQLAYYARALETVTGRPVREKLLVLLMGETVVEV